MPAGPRPMRNPDSRPPPSQRPNERWQHQGEQQNRAPDEDYEGLVDSYYDGPPRDEEMPNFDAVPGGHGHIDEDLHLGEGYGRANAPMPVDTDRGRPATDTRSFAGQAHRSRSQPNFRQQPPVPPPSTQPLGFDFGAGVQPQAIPEPNGQYHDPRNPLAPERSYSGSTSRSNGQRPLDAYSAGSGGPQQQYPARQDRSDAGQVRPYPGPRDPYGSSPGNPQTGPRPMPGPPQSAGRGRGQISAGYPGVTALARPSNPDALLEHPVPVRPGLMPINGAPPPPKQAPVRQYNNGPSPGMRSPPSSNPPSGQPAAEGPVTHEELQRLTQMVQTHPGDMVLQLVLAKKMVEAVSVLADDGGRADTKTRNRNRERYIFDAHKIIKKLVAAGDTEAIFYLADCHGRGLLGLQPDLKEAFNLYQSAAKLGHAQAAYRVAVCCELGQEDGGGTRRDPLKAIQWYKRAATLGDTPAMYKMGMIQLKGLLGQPKQPRDAVVWLKRAAEQADVENPHALHELASRNRIRAKYHTDHKTGSSLRERRRKRQHRPRRCLLTSTLPPSRRAGLQILAIPPRLCLRVWPHGSADRPTSKYRLVQQGRRARGASKRAGPERLVPHWRRGRLAAERYGGVSVGAQGGSSGAGKGAVCDGLFHRGGNRSTGELGGCKTLVLASGL